MYMYRVTPGVALSHLVGAPHIEQEESRNGGQITSVGDHELAVDVPGYLVGLPNNLGVVADRLVETRDFGVFVVRRSGTS
jgi:hypothetical protein